MASSRASTVFHWILKTKIVWIVLWLSLTVYCLVALPKLADVPNNSAFDLLPAQADSSRAKQLLGNAFQGERFQSRVVLIAQSQNPLNVGDIAYLTELLNWLSDTKQFPEVHAVISHLNQGELKPLLVTPDEKACLIILNLDTSYIDGRTQRVVDIIKEKIKQAPHNLQIGLSGDATMAHDYQKEVRKSLDQTTLLTFILVILVLVIVYRSVAAPLVSLVSILISFITSRGILTLGALHGWDISSLTELFLVVVVYGVGTDYCLFLISRFKEELIHGKQVTEAIINSMLNAGEAVICSAGTVIAALGLMYFAHFGPFHRAGPAIALSVFITLLVSLTLIPSVMSWLGPYLFWPKHFNHQVKTSRFWPWVARRVGSKPVWVLILFLVLSFPFLWQGAKAQRSFNLMSQLPAQSTSVMGKEQIQRTFSTGMVTPLTAVLKIDGNWRDSDKLNALYHLTLSVARKKEVARVLTAVQPLGEVGEMQALVLSNQLLFVKTEVEKARSGAHQLKDGLDQASSQTGEYAKSLQQKANTSFLGLGAGEYRKGYQELESFEAPLQKAQAGANQLVSGLDEMSAWLDSFTGSGNNTIEALKIFILTPEIIKQHPEIEKALSHYISEDGTSAKMDIILKQDGFSKEAMRTLQEIKRELKEEGKRFNLSHLECHFAGATAVVSDEDVITGQDFIRVASLVIIAVFFILWFLLKDWIKPIYLIFSVALSYVASIGITYLVFRAWKGIEALDWKVSFFTFVMLIALGEDYNIFFVSRVKEENKKQELHQAVEESIIKTGSVITACGLILAGTFSALVMSSLLAMAEIGFAVAIGVLLDTYIIRLWVVPALMLVEEKIRHVAALYKKEA